MFLNRGQIFKSTHYQPINKVNDNSRDPLVNLTLLLINYSERESIMSYQHQIDNLISKILGLLQQINSEEYESNFKQTLLEMYFRDFISNVNTVSLNEEAEYHLTLLIREISTIPNDINLKIQNNKNSSLQTEWIQRKKYIDLTIYKFLLENQVPIFELISKPLKVNKNHSLIDFLYIISIIITLIGIIFLLIAIFKNNT